MKLKCKVLDNKKVLVIPSVFHDMFEEGKEYCGLKCIRVARYKALMVPRAFYDIYEEGKEYELSPSRCRSSSS